MQRSENRSEYASFEKTRIKISNAILVAYFNCPYFFAGKAQVGGALVFAGHKKWEAERFPFFV
ncbi:MAG: hypothetical protein K2N58_06420 [Treponemataceae bacterium]|nr:hypothetical protein [Treponemataceae bacterium]